MRVSRRSKHTAGTQNEVHPPPKHFRTNSKTLAVPFKLLRIVGPSFLFGRCRYVMKRFPFVVVYRVTTDRIEIIAVAHGSRKPGYWKKRLAN
jgi:hypothetical protein